MKTEESSNQKIRVAVVGAGVSGLSAAWHLLSDPNQSYQVTVFESEDRLGGHAYTIPVPVKTASNGNDETVNVDVGFMVYNFDNYPNMTNWFDALGVESEKSDMALSVSLDGGSSFEWSSDGLSGLFANKRQIFSLSFYSFISDMLRFHKEAEVVLTLNPKDPRRFVTVGEYLRVHKYSESFGRNYLLPMMAALWSASMEDVLAFPMEQLVGFMCNHKMLRVFDRPLWNTVKGRSKSYTDKMAEFLEKHNAMKVSTPIQKAIKVNQNGENLCQYELFTENSKSVGIFDHIVFACHPPKAGKILSSNNSIDGENNISPELLSLLYNIEYADNIIYLHSDPKLMPKRKAAWASWNCMGNSSLILTTIKPSSYADDSSEDSSKTKEPENRMKAVYVTYYLNRLQNLQTSTDIFVSLNPHSAPDPDKTYKKFILAHPQFTQKTTESRELLEAKYQGKDNLWFAGAWSGYGFHEDGCRSGFHVSTLLSGESLPWARGSGQMVLPPPDLAPTRKEIKAKRTNLPYRLLVKCCKYAVSNYLDKTIKRGTLQLSSDDDQIYGVYGEGSSFLPEIQQCLRHGGDTIILRVLDEHFFVDFSMHGDEGLARSYAAGHFIVEINSSESNSPSSSYSSILGGNPDGLLQLFLLLNVNRDDSSNDSRKLITMSSEYEFILENLPSLLTIVPKILNKVFHFWKDRLIYLSNSLYYDNSVKFLRSLAQSLPNDIITSNSSTVPSQLLASTSPALFDTLAASTTKLLIHPKDTLENAHLRKTEALLARAKINQPGMNILLIDTSTCSYDISGEGAASSSNWGVLSAFLASEAVRRYKCKVYAITESVDELNKAMKFLKADYIDEVTFEVIPSMKTKNYRSLLSYAKRCAKKGLRFDRILITDTSTLIEKASSLQEAHSFIGMTSTHPYTPDFFNCIELFLKRSGVLVLETSTMNVKKESGGKYSYCGPLPSVAGLIDAIYHGSTLTLEHMDSLGLHHSETLKQWRKKMNSRQISLSSAGKNDGEITKLRKGAQMDNMVWRAWNFYGAYCEAALGMNKLNTVILILARPGCKDLVDFDQAKVVMQSSQCEHITKEEVNEWLK